MNYKRRLKNELAKIETPSVNRILNNAEGRTEAMPRAQKKKRLALVPMLSIILSVAIVGCAAFSVPMIIKHFNAKALAENNKQLTEVPEGFTGIWSAEQLDSVRYSLSENYILMSDISFSDEDFLEGGRFAGGWKPIGNEAAYFEGIFNGNGHTIKNLKISTDQSVTSFGLFGNTRGYFINLGMESIDISINAADKSDVRFGAIAASATFVGGCYLKDGKISVSVNGAINDASVGGLVGVCEHLDSCISYAEITVGGADGESVAAGLCAGRALSAITSVGVGSVDTNGITGRDVAVVSAYDVMPTMLTREAKNKLLERLDEYYENDYYEIKLKVMYFPLDASSENEYHKRISEKYIQLNESFEFIDGETSELLIAERMRFDPSYYEHIVKDLSGAMVKAFGGYESFMDFCYQNGIKCGIMSCYTFENESDINVEALEGFDFENIFTKKNGKLALLIFG